LAYSLTSLKYWLKWDILTGIYPDNFP
jgi:hypothetical protein